MLKKVFLIVLLIASAGGPLQAQESSESETSKSIFAGLHLTDRGWGFSLNSRFGPARMGYTISLDLMQVKDRRESLIEPLFSNRGKRYTFGKLNHLFVLTPAVGLERQVMPRLQGNLVDTRLGIKIGPALGLLNPYYILLVRQLPGSPLAETVVVAYDPDQHGYSQIAGRAGLLSSRFNPKLQLGLDVKVYALLNFAHNRRYLNGLMFGVHNQLFTQAVPIMAEQEGLSNRSFFIAGSVTFVFGNRW